MPSFRPQRGLAAAAIIVVLILVGVALVLGRRYFNAELGLDQREATEASLRRISDALIQFASLNQRLPCPATGGSDAGTEDAASPFKVCNSPSGVVPWASLAIRRSDALDGWGRKISYRVFSGNTGFTQLGGINLSDCNTQSWAAGVVSPEGKCNSSPHDTRDTTYFAYRNQAANSLSLQSEAGTGPGYAFVLVSHGESGAGAYLAEGGTRIGLPSSTVREYANTQATGTYASWTRSAPGTAAMDATFFDDAVLAAKVADVVSAAKLTARSWDEPPSTFGASAIAAAGGTVDFNTGRSTLDFGSFRVTAYGDTARNVSFDVSTGAGIGTIGSGSNSDQYVTLNRETNEGLNFVFDTPGRYLAITLSRFGDTSGELERVSFDFVIGGTTVRITKMSCRSGNGRVNFTVTPGADFTEVSIEPRLTQFFNFYSTFVVADIASCPLSNPSCRTPSSAPSEDCP